MASGKRQRLVRLAEAQNWRCAHCGQPMTFEPGSSNSASTEHVIPLARGGRRVWENEVAAHVRCNGERGVRPVDRETESLARQYLMPLAPDLALVVLKRVSARVGSSSAILHSVHATLSERADDPRVAIVMAEIDIATKAARRAKQLLKQVQRETLVAPARIKPVGTIDRLLQFVGGIWKRVRREVFRARRKKTPATVATVLSEPSALPPTKAAADWNRQFAERLAKHNRRRPTGFPRKDWRALFLAENQEAAAHPGCPPG